MAQPDVSVKLLQRCIIWWLWKHDKGPTDIHLSLTAVSMEDVYCLDSVKYWLHEFRNGCDRISDMPRSARPKSARTDDNVAAVLEAVQGDRRRIIADLSLRVDVSHSSVQRILKLDLKLCKKSAKFVPKILTQGHRDQRVNLCRENLRRHCREFLFFHKVITGDETYIYLYQPETKEQSKQWLEVGDERPTKAVQGRGTRHSKCMLVLFFDQQGIVHREFIRNQTITKQVYLQILKRLMDSIEMRHPKLWRDGDYVIHDDNAPAHRRDVVTNWVNSKHFRTMNHPPYSPDLAPADFWLFPTLKKLLRGIRFPDLNTLEFERPPARSHSFP